MNVLFALLPFADPAPAAGDVKAGWVAFGIFLAMAVGVVVIGWALTRSLKRSNKTAEAGGYDESDPKPHRR